MAAGQTASIVEQQRPNQFETRLTNIGPGEEILVTISFLQNVAFSNGEYSLRLPMTFTQRWDPPHPLTASLSLTTPSPLDSTVSPELVAAHVRRDHQLELEIELLSGIGLATIESRYHDVDIQFTSA